uniref:Type I restriction enzyme EcoR124I/EcoR124II specificity subunit n=1 Tax=Escherichia coli TaxID=562 RepID=T1S1_ECOLX|nr:RecName: Full=Type I restriction enzyme EcoR124I/EcoR124II specificity subunit; Short=S protein; AltName: Full=Type I restriction enzyme EcoR124/EcoR124/3 specificity subunit; AltName: Full=Type I specificity subunit S.EcoR124II; Short=S.EcoR124II; AltName: Full=Type-1 restriction enzyme EcoR124I/EcoR124II specificity subunit [Escherichia coli]7BST_A Chain A, Type-1 restriction enzyme EcoR124II specificity protein [Escherichia coli]7BTO_I Chain I, Type-1 restriction enzyme EcoR124II specificit
MSEMSYLEKLLDGVEVEWLPLGEITKYEQPTKYLVKAKDYHDTYTIPVLTAGKTFILGYTNETHGIYQASKAPVIIFDDFTTANKWVDFDFKAKSSAMKMVTSCDDNKTLLKYVYYWLNTLPSEFAEGDHKRQWISNYSQKKIPIPCPDNPEKSLAIQSEIVRILDKFTALTAELTAELNMRKKQYNYYRDQLLSFKEGEVEWKTLGEIGKWYGGGTPSKNKIEFWENGSIPWISPKDMGRTLVDSSEDYITEEAVLHSSTKLIPANSIAIVVRSSILDKVLPSALIKVPATLNQDMKAVIPHENILVKYIYHMIGSRGSDILRAAKKTGGSVASIDSKKLFSFKIPVPNINEQQRIVEILDKFDTLTNSITEGLPREIELRQKQYEYYRDLLFSFPKPETVSN